MVNDVNHKLYKQVIIFCYNSKRVVGINDCFNTMIFYHVKTNHYKIFRRAI